MSDDIVRFENGGLIAGVRGTSIMMAANGVIDVLQSQEKDNAVQVFMEGQNRENNFSACMRFTKNLQNYASESLIKSGDFLNQPMYCNIKDKKVAESTIKDIAYLNEVEKKSEDAENERNIAGPREIVSSPLCNKYHNKPIFWPNMTNSEEICQPENVVGLIVFDGENAILYYQNGKTSKLDFIDENSKAIKDFPNDTKGLKFNFTEAHAKNLGISVKGDSV